MKNWSLFTHPDVVLARERERNCYLRSSTYM